MEIDLYLNHSARCANNSDSSQEHLGEVRAREVVMERERSNGQMRGVYCVALLLLMVCSSAFCMADDGTQNRETGDQRSKVALYSPIPQVPCQARADAVIANKGVVSMDEQSLVDSYQSARGPYGHGNEGNRGSYGTVRSAESIGLHGGAIYGLQIENSPAGLTDVPV